MTIFVFEQEIIPIINKLRESRIFVQRIELVIEGYLTSDLATQLLFNSIRHLIPHEFIDESFNFIKLCVDLNIEISKPISSKEYRKIRSFNQNHRNLLGDTFFKTIPT